MSNEQPAALDLSSTPVSKRLKLSPDVNGQEILPVPISFNGSNNSRSNNSSPSSQPVSRMELKPNIGNNKKCQGKAEEINTWTVDQVCDFVQSIDICAEYVQVNF